MQQFLIGVASLAAFYLLVCVLFFWLQAHFVYFPSRGMHQVPRTAAFPTRRRGCRLRTVSPCTVG